MLSIVGVLVIARGQVFIGAAVSQSSTLGIAVGMWLTSISSKAEMHQHSGTETHLPSLMAIVFAIGAAVLCSRRGKSNMDGNETLVAWIFLEASSLSVLLLAHSPHGLEEVHRLMSSSLIGATASDVLLFGIILAVTVLIVVRFHRLLLIFVTDAAMAEAVGVDVKLTSVCISIFLGFSIAVSIRCAGMIYVFGCLVLPPLIAQLLCRESRPIFYLSPLIAVGSAGASFVFANYYDYPPGQMTVASLTVLLLMMRLLWLIWAGDR